MSKPKTKAEAQQRVEAIKQEIFQLRGQPTNNVPLSELGSRVDRLRELEANLREAQRDWQELQEPGQSFW